MPPELRACRSRSSSASSSAASPPPPSTVIARCASGHPLVIRNAPRDADGEPFPTTFWLTCPEAVKAVSRLESGGAIARLNERFDEIPRSARRSSAPTPRPPRIAARMLPEARGVGRRRRHATRPQVPARALRQPPRRAATTWSARWVAERVEPIHPERGRRARRRRRPGHALVPAAGRRARRRRRARSSSPRT